MKILCKKLSAIFVVLVILLTITPINSRTNSALSIQVSAKSINSCKIGDIITFGSYPQSKVTDSSIISALDSKSKNWKSYGYYIGFCDGETGDWHDGSMKTSDFMKYCDLNYNGAKYRAVIFNEYRSHCTGSTSGATSYNQPKNGYYINNVYYFKFEPLKWRVLNPEDGLILSEYAIDSQAFNDYLVFDDNSERFYSDSEKTHPASQWEFSSLRSWLNSDFYNTAFSSNEKSQIRTSNNKNHSVTSEYIGSNTNDNVFALSYEEATNSKYGFSSTKSSSSTRVTTSTDYTQCQGGEKGNFSWWLRGSSSLCYANCISYDGYPDCSDTIVSFTDIGVRPAIRISSQNGSSATTTPKTTKKSSNSTTAPSESNNNSEDHTVDTNATVYENEDFKYIKDKDLGGAVITKYIGSSVDVVIPDNIDEEPVVGIGDKAFKGTIAWKIYIPDCVVYFGKDIFNSDTIIMCSEGSQAHNYAYLNGFDFEFSTQSESQQNHSLNTTTVLILIASVVVFLIVVVLVVYLIITNKKKRVNNFNNGNYNSSGGNGAGKYSDY